MENEKNSTMLEHVLYEFDMYIRTYIELCELNNNSKIFGDNQFFINVTIESHQIHLRNLLEFFRKDGQRKNDLRVKDVVNNYNDLIIQKNENDFNYKQISRSVEHLTKDRPTIDKKVTNKYIIDYFPEMKRRIKAVVDNLENTIQDEYKDELERNLNYIKFIKDILRTLK